MKQRWDVDELTEHWSLTSEEMQLLKTKPARNHLAFIAQLKYYQQVGYFPSSSKAIPNTLLYSLANQLNISSESIKDYDWFGRSCTRHRNEILAFLDVRRVTAIDKKAFSLFLAIVL